MKEPAPRGSGIKRIDMGGLKGNILLGHGSGGRLSHELISSLFVKHFQNNILNEQGDSALIAAPGQQLAFTTDSFVVDPLVFPGGDIGKLAIAGTVNDLAVAGAIPKYISASFIIEEGFSMSLLEQIVVSMANEAKAAGVLIVTGDTKVVDKGKCDKLFINTSGIGGLMKNAEGLASGKHIKAGDRIIINGHIADHGMAVMSARNALNIKAVIESDCASLNGLIQAVMSKTDGVRFMRDATRGGLATVLAELAMASRLGVELIEEAIPVRDAVRGVCELLGFDPLYVANEGKVVMVVDADQAEAVVAVMKNHPLGMHAAVIGEITNTHNGKIWLHTSIGGKRMVDMLAGSQLPRIC
jgi:hydrogenase expression/formation protein HypE